MKISIVKWMDFDYLTSIGFSKDQIKNVEELIHKAVKEKIYSKVKMPYHNLKHIEKVIMYCIWILNEKEKNNEFVNQTDLLLLSALYHDCGRLFGVSNKKHGIDGSGIAREILKNTMEEKDINTVCLLIEEHATVSNEVDFKNSQYSVKEKGNITTLSNILKDADALDRNRIKSFRFAKCNIKYLRTNEAKNIYLESDKFLSKYEEALKQKKLFNLDE